MDIRKYLKIIPVLAFSLVVLSAGFILYYILKYGIDVPYMDQWEYVGFFDNLSKGTLTFGELFKFQGEYRQFFPNLIFVSLGWLTKWDVRYEMIVIFLLACLVSFNIFRLATITLKVEKWLKWVLFFLANLFIFSPLQYENWLFGVQIEYFMPIACVTSAMVIIYTGINTYTKLFLCVLLSIISTYSSINGFLCWIVLLPVIKLSVADKGFLKKWTVISVWLTGILISLFFYFKGYENPTNYTSIEKAINNPVEAVRYIFGILGNPIRIVHSLDHIIIVGGVLVLIFFTLILYVIWNSTDKPFFRNAIVWIMLGFYSILTAILIMLGRLGLGVYQSLSSRYTSYTLYLVVAAIFLAATVARHYSKNVRFFIVHKIFFACLVLYIIYVKIDTYPVAVNDLKNFHALMQHEKAGLLFINYISHEECINKIYPTNFEQLRERANTLNNLGYLRPALIKSNIVQTFEGAGSGKYDYGYIDKIKKINDTIFEASGYANLPNTNEPADAVLLTYENNNKESLLLTLYNGDSIHWKKTFSIGKISVSSLIINAWTFDGKACRAYRLNGSYTISKSQ